MSELEWAGLLDAVLAEWYRFGDGQVARFTAREVEAVDFCLTAYRDSIKRAEAVEKRVTRLENQAHYLTQAIGEAQPFLEKLRRDVSLNCVEAVLERMVDRLNEAAKAAFPKEEK